MERNHKNERNKVISLYENFKDTVYGLNYFETF